MKHILFIVCALLYGVLAYGESIVSTGRTLVLNGIHYYVTPMTVGKVSGWSHDSSFQDLSPITAINLDSSTFGANELEQFKQDFTNVDDVFNTDFLQGICARLELWSDRR